MLAAMVPCLATFIDNTFSSFGPRTDIAVTDPLAHTCAAVLQLFNGLALCTSPAITALQSRFATLLFGDGTTILVLKR